MARRKPAARRLSLYDFRDLDLMLKLGEIGDDEGWATVQDLSDSLGMGEDGVRSVAIRSAWMRRFGMFDYDEQQKMWRVSSGGERVTKARLRAAAAKQIDSIPDEALVDVMAHVTTRYRLGDPVMATMLRREFAYGTSARSTIWNGSRHR